MSVRSLIAKQPLAREGAVLLREIQGFSAKRTLALSGHAKLAKALDRRHNPLEKWIEKQRAALLRNHSPLIDGTLEPGPYDDGTIAEVAMVSKPARAARYLYSLAAEYGPKTVIELGTNLGVSSAYLASAGGQVTTLEASPYRLRIAQSLHKAVGLDNISYVQGLFADTLADTLKNLPPIDMAFIDGHHQYGPTLDYFAQISRHASEECVFIFDDIRWSDGMKRAWAEIKPQFTAAIEVGGMGVCQARRRISK